MGNSALLEPVRKFHRKKGKKPVQKSDVWWLRKKVPERYRALVGRAELWRSLETTDRKIAGTRCAQLSAELEAEWMHREAALRDVDLREAAKRPVVPEARLSALQREVHERTPGRAYRQSRLASSLGVTHRRPRRGPRERGAGIRR